ncbi:MAG: PKD domain-containing protein [Minisyncoccia bacterium]
MKYFLATLIILITLPLVAQAEVRINEIAWMGVSGTSGQYGEWFELYNDSAEAVSLVGWGVYKDGGTKVVFMLSKTIPAFGFLLVERVTASMPDPVPGIADESGTFSNNGFANTGEYLVLKNEQEIVVHELDFTSGWPAGDSTTKETMQYADGSWITAVATPNLQNATLPEDSFDTEEDPLSDTPGESTGEETPATTAQSQTKKKSVKPPVVYEKNKPSLKVVAPSTAYQGMQYEYEGTVVLERGSSKKGTYLWNMGDGTVIRTDTLSTVRHTYEYPGVYTVTLAYHTAQEFTRALLHSSAVVTVVASTVELSLLNPSTLQIKNTAKTSIDMSGWRLYTPEGYAEFPLFTVLAPKGNIALPISRVGLRTLTTATLKTKEGNTMAVLGMSEKSTQRVQSSTRASPPLSFIPYTTAVVNDTVVPEETTPVYTPKPKDHRAIVIGAVVIIGVLSLLLLERFIARSE